MSLVLERFGQVSLPLVEAEQEIGAIGTRTAYVNLPTGGAYNAYGSGRAPRGLYQLRAHGETLVDSFGALTAEIDVLRALRGRRDKLYARMDDQSVRWVWAGLREIPITRTVDHVLYIASDLVFDIESPVWNGTSHGGGWLWNDGTAWDSGAAWDEAVGDVFTLLDSANNEFQVINDGNTSVDDAIITIEPSTAIITGFTFLSTGPDFTYQAEFEYIGTIGVGQALVLDCGAQSATISAQIATPAVATDTELHVTNSTGFTTGHQVEVLLDNGHYHRTTVAGTADATHVTLTDALPSSATAGNAVVLSAWQDLVFGDRHRLGSQWFRLDPGITEVEIDIDSTEDGTATFRYHDAFE